MLLSADLFRKATAIETVLDWRRKEEGGGEGRGRQVTITLYLSVRTLNSCLLVSPSRLLVS